MLPNKQKDNEKNFIVVKRKEKNKLGKENYNQFGFL
jgi:hypothetical protein